MDPVEQARVEHQDLAATTLLGRGAHHLHREIELVGERREREPGTHGGSRDHVVAARVPDARQGVVLGADRDGERAGPHGRDECRVEAGDTVIDREAARSQRLRDTCRGAVLLEGQFGVGMDGVGQGDEALRRRGDDRSGPPTGVADPGRSGHTRSSGPHGGPSVRPALCGRLASRPT
jgi:hypothetical protein